MRLILHIGGEKTGTTALQDRLSGNRARLDALGIRYPACFGPNNHRRLALHAMDFVPTDGGFVKFGISTPAQHEAFRRGIDRAFEGELAAHDGKTTWIVSNEHLQTGLADVAGVERVHALLAPHFDRIDVLCQLRPQVDTLVSLASTHARHGRRVDRARFEAASADDPALDHEGLVGRWEQVFGADSITLVPYRRQRDLLPVLARMAGFEIADWPPARYTNRALGWRAMALVNALGAGRDTADGALDGDQQIVIDALPESEPLRIGLDLARRIHGRFAEANARLAGRRDELDTDDLTPDWSQYEGEPNVDLLETPCVFPEQLGAAVRQLNREATLQRAHAEIAEAALAAATDRPGRARKRLAQAGALLEGIPREAPFAQRRSAMAMAIARLARRLVSASDG